NIISQRKVVVLAKASSNGINVSRFTPGKANAPEVQIIREEFRLTTDDFVIGFVGRVVRSKGVEEIYHAFKNLRGSYANLKLLVVGPVEKTRDAVDDDILNEMNADTNVNIDGIRIQVEQW